MATLTRQIHRLEESITTSETDVTELAQYRALGKLGDIQRIVSEHGTWGTERTNNAKGAALQKAATAPKTALNAPLLASLAGALDVDYLTEGEGENAEGFVKLKDGGRKKLTEYVVQTWPNLAEQLKASPVVPVKQVKRMGRGAPAGGGDKPSKAEEIREEVQNRRNGGAVKSSGDSAGGNANTSQSRAGTLLRRNR